MHAGENYRLRFAATYAQAWRGVSHQRKKQSPAPSPPPSCPIQVALKRQDTSGGRGTWSFEVGQVRWNYIVPRNDGLNMPRGSESLHHFPPFLCFPSWLERVGRGEILKCWSLAIFDFRFSPFKGLSDEIWGERKVAYQWSLLKLPVVFSFLQCDRHLCLRKIHWKLVQNYWNRRGYFKQPPCYLRHLFEHATQEDYEDADFEKKNCFRTTYNTIIRNM